MNPAAVLLPPVCLSLWLGMMPLAESLATLVREGTVHPSHAYRKAPNREQFLAILRRDGVDTSTAERLA